MSGICKKLWSEFFHLPEKQDFKTRDERVGSRPTGLDRVFACIDYVTINELFSPVLLEDSYSTTGNSSQLRVVPRCSSFHSTRFFMFFFTIKKKAEYCFEYVDNFFFSWVYLLWKCSNDRTYLLLKSRLKINNIILWLLQYCHAI